MLVASGFAGSAALADEPAPEPAPIVETTDEIGTLAYPGCQLGWACVWQYTNYGGGWAAAPSDGPFTKWSVNGARTGHNSAGANGNSCKYSKFWNSDRDKYFTLQSASWTGGQANRDANLSNGAGFGGNSNEAWKNRIRRVTFNGGSNCV